jgi:hypothetical protein
MSRATPDPLIAHADLLHAVDKLLSAAETVREKRDVLDRLFSEEHHDKATDRPHKRGEAEDASR